MAFAQSEVIENCWEFCDQCKSKEDLNWKCIQCLQILCRNCQNAHINGTVTKNHFVFKRDDEKNEQKWLTIFRCSQHDRNILYFCQDDDVSLCDMCLLRGHRTHSVDIIENAAYEERAEIKTINDAIEDIIQQYKENANETIHLKSKLSYFLHNKNDGISNSGLTMKKQIDTLETHRSNLLEERIDLEKRFQRITDFLDSITDHELLLQKEMVRRTLTELKEKAVRLLQRDKALQINIRGDLMDELDVLGKTTNRLSENMTILEAENDKLQKKLMEMEDTESQLRERNERLKSENDKISEVMRSKSIQLTTAEETINKLRTDITQLEKEATRKEQEIQKATFDSGMKGIEISRLEQTLAQTEAAYSELNRKSHDEVARLRNTIDHLQSTVVAERNAKEDALTRLRAAGASSLRDKNPGITDLSDPNRPLKLSEKISELYDNEWTNAMEKLEDEGLDEDDAVVVLLRILTTLFSKFKEAGGKHLASIPKMIVVPDIDDNDDKTDDKTKIPDLPTDIMKPIKDFRKAHAEKAIERLKKKTISILENDDQTEKVLRLCSEYIAGCTEICWLMCVHDPPVHMRWDFKPNDDFDTNIMRSYTKSGKYVSYVVWPVLYLHEGGPLLAKGVVQGRKTKVEAPNPANNDVEKDESDENHEQSPPDAKSSDGKDTTDSELPNASEEKGQADDAGESKEDDSSSDPGSNYSKIGNECGIQEDGNSDQRPNNLPGDTANSNDDHDNVRDERSKSIESNKSEDENFYDPTDNTDNMPQLSGNQDDKKDQGLQDDTANNENKETETNPEHLD